MSNPSEIRCCVVISISRMFTRPDRYKYLFRTSPWRFSSAVQARTHLLQPFSFPLCWSIPSTSINQDSYVGRASSVMVSATKVTQKSYPSSLASPRSFSTSSKNLSLWESGKKSVGCHIFSVGIRNSFIKPSTLGSMACITSNLTFFIDILRGFLQRSL